jgi:hypothetical protein
MDSRNLAIIDNQENEIPDQMDLNEEVEETQLDDDFLLGTKTLPNIIQLCNAHTEVLKPVNEIQSGEFIAELLMENDYFRKIMKQIACKLAAFNKRFAATSLKLRNLQNDVENDQKFPMFIENKIKNLLKLNLLENIEDECLFEIKMSLQETHQKTGNV